MRAKKTAHPTHLLHPHDFTTLHQLTVEIADEIRQLGDGDGLHIQFFLCCFQLPLQILEYSTTSGFLASSFVSLLSPFFGDIAPPSHRLVVSGLWQARKNRRIRPGSWNVHASFICFRSLAHDCAQHYPRMDGRAVEGRTCQAKRKQSHTQWRVQHTIRCNGSVFQASSFVFSLSLHSVFFSLAQHSPIVFSSHALPPFFDDWNRWRARVAMMG